MWRMLPAVFVAAALGIAGLNCNKADSSSQTGSAPPVNEPGATAKGGTPEGAIPTDNGAKPADGAEFQLDVVPQPAVGLEQTFSVHVMPGKGYHMNKDYPTKLTLELPAGVSSPKPILVAEDAEKFTESSLTFGVKLAAAAKGSYTVPATLKFAVCTDSTCNPKKQAISLPLQAQ
jgi:hypothetical protein